MRFPVILVFAIASICVAQSKQPQTADRTDLKNRPSPVASTLTPAETSFVQEKLKGGRQEVEMARMALSQGSDKDVKSFAQRLVNDHSAANAKLEKMAKNNSVAVDSTPPARDEHMAGLRGADFDKAFVQDMVEKHRMGIASFEAALKDAKNPELRTFISSTLPTLREHLKQAESLNASKVKK
jgi:putative membrane protein